MYIYIHTIIYIVLLWVINTYTYIYIQIIQYAMRNRKGHLQTPVFSKQRFPSQHSWSTVVGALHQIQVPVSGKGASCLIDHIMVASVASSGSRCFDYVFLHLNHLWNERKWYAHSCSKNLDSSQIWGLIMLNMCLLIFLWAPQVPFTPISAGWSANFFLCTWKPSKWKQTILPIHCWDFFHKHHRVIMRDLTDIWAPRITKVSKVSKVHSWNLENSSQSIQGEHRAMPSVEPKCSSGAYFLGYGHNWGLKLHKLQCKIHGGHCQTRIGYLRWIYVESVECIWMLDVCDCETKRIRIILALAMWHNVTISLPRPWMQPSICAK